ncbi:hypothetical protein SMZ52_000928 [Cronobacter sakazakii]|uniref:hypothetical protein n=1 Tax=Cronobacter sakazakii TaxID=28141 RepID=UPI000CFBD527|nr:hypothetical protein [Cronobacter sakazakii]EGT5653937.1 hypothetical protein [Cronobacter sakazakii]EGT5751234.1 hypothetical protein [Cronobacter sakazakii]ELY2811732.1 hypothetical protein [Cronobacter sakazakii]ELY3709434.1 hypothetical protein [Cronobacter sakazakii]ELY4420466.1 hypothetical protein [Cronobacter sakazakii]
MSKGIIICLCDITGRMAQPWVNAGYEAILVDPQHPEGVHVDGRITRVGQIIDHPETWSVLRRAIGTGRVVFVMGFPPCTDLAVSGARWFNAKREADPAFQFKAMQVVWQCQVIGEMAGVPWAVENPVSKISSLWRKPDYSFHPSDFTGYCNSDNYTKKTCLWVGGGFVMPEPLRDETLGAPDDRIHKCPPGPERANIRSATPSGFAIAVFKANAPCEMEVLKCENGKAA